MWEGQRITARISLAYALRRPNAEPSHDPPGLVFVNFPDQLRRVGAASKCIAGHIVRLHSAQSVMHWRLPTRIALLAGAERAQPMRTSGSTKRVRGR